MARKSWREISTKNHEDPARAVRVERGARAMITTRAIEQEGVIIGHIALDHQGWVADYQYPSGFTSRYHAKDDSQASYERAIAFLMKRHARSKIRSEENSAID